LHVKCCNSLSQLYKLLSLRGSGLPIEKTRLVPENVGLGGKQKAASDRTKDYYSSRENPRRNEALERC
jgi:hypothetical protein